jgi:hypothetical protein
MGHFVGTRKSRGGFAIFLVVMITAVISVFASIVFFQSRQTRYQGEEKRDRAQAQFLARGAENHLLLKFKLLPAELYEAVSYAVGRNPFFDFSIPITSVSGNTFVTPLDAKFGPMFFTGTNPGAVTSDGSRVTTKRSNETNLYTNSAVNFTTSTSDPSRAKMEYLLNHYLLDVETDFPDSGDSAIVTVSSVLHKDVAQMGVSPSATNFSNKARMDWQDPFCGSYQIASLRLLGSGGAGASGQKYSSDSLLITAEATILRDQQISLVTKLANGSPKSFPIQHRANSGFANAGPGWVELQTQMESDTDQAFKNRGISNYSVAANRPGFIGGTSGRRTEIVTDVYFVTRK